jgi:hypothetical protein
VDQVFKKTQNMEFVSQVLPALFHGSPDPFLFYLNRDGNKFLNFYWNEAGKHSRPSSQTPAFGMNYDIRCPRNKVTVALIRMPTPMVDGEAHLAALCYRPARTAPILFWMSDVSKVLVLELSAENSTLLVEYTRRHNRAVLGRGPEPRIEDFYEAVLKEIED